MGTQNHTTIAIASGKGGTGKTLVATSLAAMLVESGADVALADCDAEAPNDHLFFELETLGEQEISVASVRVDADACTACARCRRACAFGAVRMLGSSAIVFNELCHGCGICERICPVGAISEIRRRVGTVEVTRPVDRRAGLTVVTGRLDVGEVKTPDVIRGTRAAAEGVGADVVVCDAPPGVACAAVAAIHGADVVVHVAEPTSFGIHDLELSVQLAEDMGSKSLVVINRFGSDPVDIEAWCEQRHLPVSAILPFDRDIAEIYARGAVASDESARVAEELTRLVRALGLGDDAPKHQRQAAAS